MVVEQGYKQTEVGVIPEDWEICEFKDLADKNIKWSITGGPFGSNLKTSDYTSEGIQIIQLQNIGDGVFYDDSVVYTSETKANELKSCNVYPNEIILSKMGDPVARACFVPTKAKRFLMASDGIRLVVDENRFNKYFVFSYINSKYFRNKAIEVSTGSTRQRIGLPKLKSIKIIKPPLPEQTAIANALSDMDELIAQTEKLIEKKKAIKQGLMQELLRPKEGWVNVAIRDISKVGRGRVISHTEISKSIENLYPVYSSQTTNNGIMGFIDTFDFEGEYITWTTDGEKAGTVFYRNGKFNCTNVCGTIKLNNYNAKFIAYVLANEAPKHVSRNLANPKLMNEPMKNVRITIPVNVDDQEVIAKIISTFEDEISTLEKKFNKFKLQKQGMMQALLTGKIRLV